MSSRRVVAQLIAVAVGLLFWYGQSGAALADGAGAPSPADQIRLTGLVANQTTSTGPNGKVQLNATVTYQLASVPRAFVLPFIFKDDDTTATESTASKEWVTSGIDPVHLTATFQPEAGVHTWTMVIGIFKDDQTLLAWTSTEPFTLGEWPGRAAFNRALADRRSGNYAHAVDDLDLAIQIAPQIGQYYCWRADSRVHLGEYGRAVDDYRQALQLTPDSRSCRLGLGVALLWDGQQPQAISALTSVITQSGQADRWTALALRARGIAHADLDQFSDAIADYQAYLSLAPKTSDQARIESWIGELQSAESQAASSATSG
ncbi:MAG: tetratricopeptide repeat protein [Chloroflexota bacterium]